MKLKGITQNLMPVLAASAGAVGAGYVTSKIPVENDKVKAGIVAALGLVLAGSGKGKGIVKDLGTGLAIGGVMKLAQSFGIGSIPDPIMELEDFDIYEDGDVNSLNGIPNPIMGADDGEDYEY